MMRDDLGNYHLTCLVCWEREELVMPEWRPPTVSCASHADDAKCIRRCMWVGPDYSYRNRKVIIRLESSLLQIMTGLVP